MLRYKGAGGGKREGRDIDVGRILGYSEFKFLDKLDSIADEENKYAILVLAILVTIFRKEMYYSLRSSSLKSPT